MKQTLHDTYTAFRTKLASFLTWQWVKRFLYWLVVSAGTVSECIFLIASLWVSVNATVHPLMLEVMSEHMTMTLSQLSISMFTALPEIILGLAVVTTYRHIKFFIAHRKSSSLVWALLFGLPTLVFASLTVWTLCASSLEIGYIMPAFLIATRVLSGYVYGFLSMLHMLIGEPDQADYVSALKAKNTQTSEELTGVIETLNLEIAQQKSDFTSEIADLKERFTQIIEELNSENDQVKQLVSTQQNQIIQLSEKATSLVVGPIERFYPHVKSELLDNGVKSVSLDDLVRLTGLSKRKIQNATLRKTGRNGELYLVSSVIEWLKSLPISSNGNGNGNGQSHDTDALNLPLYSVVEN